jgi:hypothetical protein
MAANDSATLKVNARAAKADPPAQSQSPPVPDTGTTLATVVSTDSGPALMFKGPPRKFEPRHTARTVILVVFSLFVVGGGAAAFVQFRRRTIKTAAPAKEKPIEGLEFKEESSHPPDTVLEA